MKNMEFEHPPKKWSAAWLSCGCLLVVLMIGLLVPGIAVLIWNERNAQDIARRVATIRQNGLPADFVDLKEFSRLPSGTTDTIDLWLEGTQPLVGPATVQAVKRLPIVGQGQMPKIGELWPEIEEAAEYLANNQASLDKFHEAARLGGAASFPMNHQAGAATDLSWIQNQRAAARILTLEALVHAHRGNAKQCAESIQASIGVEHSLRRAPFLVSYLVQLAIRNMALKTLAQTIGSVPFTDEQLRKFRAEIQSWEDTKFLEHAISTDRVFGFETYRYGGTAKSKLIIPLSHSEFAFYLQVTDDVYSAAQLGFPEALGNLQKAKSTATNQRRFGGALTMNLLPVIEAAFQATAREQTIARATDTAIAVILFQRSQGTLPESLEQLVPDLITDVPKDAFSGASLCYRRTQKDFVIYGFSHNGLDDGGNPDQKSWLDDVVHVQLKGQEP